ncbi:hypothetical protein ACWEQL_10835 [Kitasatospora sp. NPDC004240]
MYLSAAATPAEAQGPGPVRLPLRVRRIAARRFGPGRPFVQRGPIPWLEHYLADMSELYGVGVRPGFLEHTTRNSFAEMAGEVAPSLGPFGGPVDVVAAAFATADSDMERSPTSYVCELLPGDPLPLGVTDQGAVGPFTALRLAGEYVRASGFETAVLVTLDQSSQPYELPVAPGQEVTADCAVGLGLAADEQADTRLVQWSDVAPERVAGLLGD